MAPVEELEDEFEEKKSKKSKKKKKKEKKEKEKEKEKEEKEKEKKEKEQVQQELDDSWDAARVEVVAPVPVPPQQEQPPPSPPPPPFPVRQSGPAIIRVSTKWAEIQRMCGPCGRPVVNDTSSAAHPFGATLFYGPLPGVVFEVMANDCIASVTLSSPHAD